MKVLVIPDVHLKPYMFHQADHKRFDNDRTEIVAQMAQSNIQQFIEVSLDLNSNTIMRGR